MSDGQIVPQQMCIKYSAAAITAAGPRTAAAISLLHLLADLVNYYSWV